MKSPVLILFTILILAHCTPPSTTVDTATLEADVAKAKQLIQGSFDDIWGGLDSSKIMNYHTDDFFILEQGTVWTNQEIKDYIKRSLAQPDRPLRINKMEYISTERYGDAINMAYHNYATFMMNDSLVGSAQWLESATAIKTHQGWRLKMMHSTWVPKKD